MEGKKFLILDDFAKSIDSIFTNISEGFGRHSKKDKIKFFRYNFEPLLISEDWEDKSYFRKLLSKDEFSHIFSELIIFSSAIKYLILFNYKKLND